jgi:large subunit ribosomal protein L25
MGFATNVSLDAAARDERGKNAARRLRRLGQIPLTVYGGGEEAMSGSVGRRALAAILRSSGGRNTIFTLNLNGGSAPVKIADLQLDPVKGTPLHVDLMRISLTEKTEFEVPVRPVGEADGVRNASGILDMVMHSLEIRCLPTDLPDSIEVDVTALGIGDHFRVRDLKLDPEKIEVLADSEVVIATVVPPRIEEEPTVAAAAEAPAEPEVIKKGKTEEES